MPVQAFLPDAQVTLPLSEIQGDVLIALKKNAEVFVFFGISDAARFRRELASILDDVTFCDQAKRIEEDKQAGHIEPFLGLNVAFSVHGLRKLFPSADVDKLDPSFVAGADVQAPALGDKLADWLAPYTQGVDGVLLVTGIDHATAADQAESFVRALRHSTQVLHLEHGLVRSGAQKGHEHFGFLDGVSQPGVLGLTRPTTADPTKGLPGQDLVEPGEFIFGPFDQEEGAGPATPPVDWMQNASYLVFRRLRQDVGAFDAYLQDNFTAAEKTSPEHLGAHLVGRWKSGAPTLVTPERDDAVLAADPTRNNDFDFGAADSHQAACPFVAHIRKTYPRDDFDPPLKDESEKHRILRAGIPFGADDEADKGLLFVSYQTSIVDQFEFIQTKWANNPNFIFGKTTTNGTPITTGLDVVMGQGAPRTAAMSDPAGDLLTLPDAPQFVTATGGAYLLSLGRKALHDLTLG